MNAQARTRTFFALWPPEEVSDALAVAARGAQDECGGRAMPAERIHVTLFFIGDIARERISDLKALAGTITGDGFDLELDTLGSWRHNRIVWAGVRDAPAPLGVLVSAIQERLVRQGVRPDERPYCPHVTLVRDARRAPARATLSIPLWRVRDFALVESVSVAGGVRYDVLARWPLRESV